MLLGQLYRDHASELNYAGAHTPQRLISGQRPRLACLAAIRHSLGFGHQPPATMERLQEDLGELPSLARGSIATAKRLGHTLTQFCQGSFTDHRLGQVQAIAHAEAGCLYALGQALDLIGHQGDDAQEGVDRKLLHIQRLQNLALLGARRESIDLPELLEEGTRSTQAFVGEPRIGARHLGRGVLVLDRQQQDRPFIFGQLPPSGEFREESGAFLVVRRKPHPLAVLFRMRNRLADVVCGGCQRQ